MQSIVTWVQDNPALLALCWALSTALLTAVFGPHSDEQLATYPSWLASFLRVCGALGVDVPKLIAILRGDK